MNHRDFRSYKLRYQTAIERALSNREDSRLSEAGFPAYTHNNTLINKLFWRRLHVVMEYLQPRQPYNHILDFGCGSGVMLPYLSSISREVTAVDVDLLPLELVKQHIPLPENVHVRASRQNELPDLPARSFDTIIALDVLEHVDDLPGTLTQLMVFLKPAGQLIISGPTENLFYQIGRKLAGPEYSGEYHERGIAEIKAETKKLARMHRITTLYRLIPLFEVFAAIKE